MKVGSPAPSTPIQPEHRRGSVPLHVGGLRSKVEASFGVSSPASPDPNLEKDATTAPSDNPPAIRLSLPPSPSIPWAPNPTIRADSNVSDDPLQNPVGQPLTEYPNAIRATEPASEAASSTTSPTELSQPRTRSQPQHHVITPTVTPPPTHDNPELEKPTAASVNEVDSAVYALTNFLNEISTFTPLGLSAKDLQGAGILTLAELKVVALKPEAFREKIPVLANLHERNEYLWFMFRRGLKKLLDVEQPADNLVPESDPIKKFIRSLGGGQYIDVEAFAMGLGGAGITSEMDLLALSHNLEKFVENSSFLQEFAASNKFGWTIFQVGLGGLPGREMFRPRSVAVPPGCR